ncbi:SufD family Fe-S cluster assembly protein [Maridesulfovibrio sp.]|jgi:Fe-S cluster assembly scaffold protein SufB|uniref:SufB/SufD family protein n=1 Tax=Maridesulfovibrio sp. TaxID=2795000 RepID=UPI0029C9DC37|nr:SufD family Fe-S cluster assembly protein [Maridesulfovibrio sp.]
MSKVDLNDFKFEGLEHAVIEDLTSIEADEKEQLIMAGVDVDSKDVSATFMQVDHSNVHCGSNDKDVEVMDIKKALEKYDGLPDYYFKLIDKDKNEITRNAAENLHGGYFVRTKKGAKVEKPVQSCLFLKAENSGQNIHNIVIVEEDSELHIITGCAAAHEKFSGGHFGLSEIYVKKGGKLTFTMVHNWGENTVVRPSTMGVVEEGGTLINNYVLMKKVKDLQSYPTIFLNGEGAVARFNSVLVAPEGSYVDTGTRIIQNAPDTKAETISRTITTGGTIIARGHIQGNNVPARGHIECQGLILGGGRIHAVPELEATVEGVELSHEAAVGKIAQEEIEYLMARGMDEDQATSTIVRGFLNVDIMGLPEKLQKEIDKQIEELDSSDAM